MSAPLVSITPCECPGAWRGKRHTFECKRAVCQYAREHSIKAANRKFGVSPDIIAGWMHRGN